MSSKLNAFVSLIAKGEGGKSQAKVGDIRQVLKLANKQLGGALYKIIDIADIAVTEEDAATDNTGTTE